MLMGVLKPEGRLPDDVTGVSNGQRPAMAYQLRQVQPLDVLHDQEVRAFHLPGIHRAHDVGVVHRPDCLHLSLKAGDAPRVLHAILREHLQGHNLLELGVPGLVDRAHAPLTELLKELVFAQFPDNEGLCGGLVGGLAAHRHQGLCACY